MRWVILLAVLAGCESDARQLERLQLANARGNLGILVIQQAIDSISGRATLDSLRKAHDADFDSLMNLTGRAYLDAEPAWEARSNARLAKIDSLVAFTRNPPPGVVASLDSLQALLHEAVIKRDLAQRDLNRFMNP